MSAPSDHGAEQLKVAPAAGAFLYHPALCQLALPLRAAKGPWNRDVGTASVTIDMGDSGLSMPSGKLLRLLLIAILDGAMRSGETRVDMDTSSAAFARRLGLDFNPAQNRALVEQLDRLVGGKINVGLDNGPLCSLFDGRSRPAVDAAGWRPSLKLNAKFLARLQEKTIPLDRAVVLGLWENPTALDAYAAIAFVTSELPAGEAAMTGWDDLLARFGAKGQDLAAFRVQFEEDLASVQTFCPALSLVIGDEGVEIRMRDQSGSDQPAADAPESAVNMSAAEPVNLESSLEEELAALVAAQIDALPDTLPEPEPEPESAEPVTPVAQPAPQPVPVPRPAPQAPYAAPRPTEPAAAPEAEAPAGHRSGAGRMLALKSHLTGLQQVIWLQRSQGRDDPLVEVTPGGRYDPSVVTVLALEPMVVQIAGGLYQRDFDRVSSWTMANRDLIDAFWFDEIDDIEAIFARVKKVPAPGWRD